jgi:hypothetical protein
MGASTKMIKPSSAVSCELGKYSDDGERIKLLEKREDFATYSATYVKGRIAMRTKEVKAFNEMI